MEYLQSQVAQKEAEIASLLKQMNEGDTVAKRMRREHEAKLLEQTETSKLTFEQLQQRYVKVKAELDELTDFKARKVRRHFADGPYVVASNRWSRSWPTPKNC